MSTDFLVNTAKKDFPKFAVQVKHSESLNNPRIIEKLELERRYWKQKNVPWFLFTERDIPRIVARNIEWLYPVQAEVVSYERLTSRLAFYSSLFHTNFGLTLIEISKSIDVTYSQSPGEALKELRQCNPPIE